jgi:hypothetical protein
MPAKVFTNALFKLEIELETISLLPGTIAPIRIQGAFLGYRLLVAAFITMLSACACDSGYFC